MTDLILIGGGGHCKSTIDIIEQGKEYNILGVVERQGSNLKDVAGYRVLGTDEILFKLLKSTPSALVTIGQVKTPYPRAKAYAMASKLGAKMPSIISSSAYVSSKSKIGRGTVVMNGAQVNLGACIGENVILNSKCLIEHDVKVGNHCHISTGALINGDVKIGEGCFIGSGAVIAHGVSIGANSIIGIGCIVTHDVAPKSLIKRKD